MFMRREHRTVLSEQLRAAGRAAHRDALAAERSRRESERDVLRAERDRLNAARLEHKRALRQNRWLLALVDLMAARRRPAA